MAQHHAHTRAMATPTRGMHPVGMLSPTRSSSIAAQRESKRRLLRGLWCTGVFLRLLTVVNGLSLLGSTGYVVYTQVPELFEMTRAYGGADGIAAHVRTYIELAMPLLCGLFLLALEWGSTCSEAAVRANLGFAFSACGRFLLFVTAATVCVPAVLILPWDSLEFLMLAAAVAMLPANALLQAWLLSCIPEFSKHTVAELNVPNLRVDSSQFPQIYQRDEGEHLHLGVLLPGFASRESCTMTANCSAIQLVGDIAQLDAPFTSVDSSNSTAGPFGPFKRDVQLMHPVDVTTPVESRMGLGILEFRFQKGYPPAE